MVEVEPELRQNRRQEVPICQRLGVDLRQLRLAELAASASAGIAIGARIGPTFGILVRNFATTAAPGPVRSAASASAWSTSPPRTLSGMSNLPAHWASLS